MQLTGAGSLVMYRRVMDVPSFGAFLVVLFPIPSRLPIVSVTTDAHPSTDSPIYFRKPLTYPANHLLSGCLLCGKIPFLRGQERTNYLKYGGMEMISR